jgi:hypothetical protein
MTPAVLDNIITMNPKVRTYLIETARKGGFVYYSDMVRDCELGFDLSTSEGQWQLKQTLIDVSRFENSHDRPMLTSIAIGKQDNDHGNGFYELAEEFGFGKNKVLHSQLWRMEEAQRTREFWQNDDHYRKFSQAEAAASGLVDPEFFTREEVELFKQWQYKAYNKKDQAHVEAKNFLMSTVWEKSIYLGNQIINHFQGFSIDAKKIWHQRGWKTQEDGTKAQAAIFKHYTWVKIFRNTYQGKDIFFTFGIDAHPDVEAFIYKIDCQRERDEVLSPDQIRLFDSLVPKSAKWNEIPFEELFHENWKSLTKIGVDFINKHLAQYDAIVEAVWGAKVSPGFFKNTLIWRDKPKNGFDALPATTPAFRGIDIDYEARSKEQKDLGDAGELLVKQNEINFLIKIGLSHLAEKVKIAQDGEGYDVLSYDEHGNERYIEVKTTTGNEYSPFYLSINEVSFMKLHPGQYIIYRVFHYDADNNFGEYFEIKDDIESQLLLKPIEFKAWLKQENQ